MHQFGENLLADMLALLTWFLFFKSSTWTKSLKCLPLVPLLLCLPWEALVPAQVLMGEFSVLRAKKKTKIKAAGDLSEITLNVSTSRHYSYICQLLCIPWLVNLIVGSILLYSPLKLSFCCQKVSWSLAKWTFLTFTASYSLN